MVHLKRLLRVNVAYLGILVHFFKNIYYQHVRNAILNVCAKHVPVWGDERAITGRKMTCPLIVHRSQ